MRATCGKRPDSALTLSQQQLPPLTRSQWPEQPLNPGVEAVQLRVLREPLLLVPGTPAGL